MSATGHWRIQRLTSVLLIPLGLWLLWAGASLAGADHATALAFMGRPLNAVAVALLALIGLYHAQLGIQVIIEDYVPGARLPGILLALTRLLCVAGALAAVAAALALIFGVAA